MNFGDIWSYVGTIIVSGGVTQVVNWRINRKKSMAEAKNAEAEASNTVEDARGKEIENIRKSVEVYQTIITDLKARNDEQNERISELTQEVNTLRDQLRIERNEHQKQIDGLQKQIIEITRVLGMENRRRIRDEKTGRFQKKEDKNTVK